MFFNRNMGNVEYVALHYPPDTYQNITTDVYAGSGYGGGVGLNYDTAHEATLASRAGSFDVTTVTPDSWKFPKTHSFSGELCPTDSVQPGVRSRLRRYARARSGQPGEHERRARGALLQGTVGNADLSDPVQRFALQTGAVNQFRPYTSYPRLIRSDFEVSRTTTRCR